MTSFCATTDDNACRGVEKGRTRAHIRDLCYIFFKYKLRSQNLKIRVMKFLVIGGTLLHGTVRHQLFELKVGLCTIGKN